MSSSRGTYDALPRTSNEYTNGIHDEGDREFKDKPVSRFSSRRFRRTFRFCRPVYILIAFAFFMTWQLLFNSSYTSPPPFAINTTERIYIAANIVDEELIRGPWGASLKALVQLLGKDRVFVSIYGNPKAALEELAAGLDCEKSIVSETDVPLDMTRVPKTMVPSMGKEKIKRIAYLAEVRNMALRPLQSSKTKFDKVLFLNDIFYDPADALRLIWGTNNMGPEGKATYKAACAADFATSWKYSDTFATRDAEGFSIGVPLFPWFTGAGAGASRADMLAGRDVRVTSCWGGMVSFDAQYFQPNPSTVAKELPPNGAAGARSRDVPQPLTFRSWQPEPYWDASECCLIHADILASSPKPEPESDPYDSGIYMNPFVRVSYSASTQKWIPLGKRFERLFYPLQTILDNLLSFPLYNPRRLEMEGQVFTDKHWVPGPNISPSPAGSRRISKRSNEKHTVMRPAGWWTEQGSYEEYNRTAQRGAYCSIRQLLVVKDKVRGKDDKGGMWDKLIDEVPPLGV